MRDYVNGFGYSIRNRNPAGAAQGITSGGATTSVSTQGVESDDPRGAFTVASNAVTIIRPGLYQLEAGVRWASQAGGARGMGCYINGSAVATDRRNDVPAAQMDHNASRLVRLQAGDVFTLEVFQTSGSTVNVEADRRTFRSIRFLRD